MKLAAWRLVRTEHANRAFDGEGARLYGGRWNSPGLPAVYAAGSRALAALEVLAHLPKSLRTAAFSLHRIEFDPTAVDALDIAALPGNWTQFPPPNSTQELGRLWLVHASHPVLRVPSMLVPEEANYLINPRHPAFAALRTELERPFFFDSRLG